MLAVGRQPDLALQLDLHGFPLGAVADNMNWKRPGRPTPDQRAVGARGGYFNSGVLLIDTARLEAGGNHRARVDAGRRHGEGSIRFDQPLLNIGAAGRRTRLHPAWNCQRARGRPFHEMLVDAPLVHFLGRVKPWSDPKAQFPVRYRRMAERFLSAHFPDAGYSFGTQGPQVQRTRLLAVPFGHLTRAGDVARLVHRFGADITATPGRGGRAGRGGPHARAAACPVPCAARSPTPPARPGSRGNR